MSPDHSSTDGGTEQLMEARPETALDTARHQLTRAASQIDVDRNIVERLTHPRAVHEVTIPLRWDDGTVEVYQGYRVQHDNVRGP